MFKHDKIPWILVVNHYIFLWLPWVKGISWWMGWPHDHQVNQMATPFYADNKIQRDNHFCEKKIVIENQIYPYKTECLYLCMYLFHKRTAQPISTKFCTDFHTNTGKVLNTSMTCQSNPLTPGYPKLQNLSRSLEKKLCFWKNVQRGDLISLKKFPVSAGPQLASNII